MPGKMLREIAGEPLIAHTVRAVLASGLEALVATDDAAVADAARTAGADALITRADHHSGTDRIAEVAERLGWAEMRIVVNIQGDEPLMPAVLIEQVAATLAADPGADLATAATQITSTDAWQSADVVKVVTNDDGRALYFSRSPIPCDRDGDVDRPPVTARRHIGIYAYRVGALRTLAAAPAASLETLEKLEQLRALAIGQAIAVVDACETPGPGVDVAADLDAVSAHLQPSDKP